ncbi:Major sperm protein [Caenorhabditis elegans]|uniref:Major sperm protein n=1 Tax=Caenorhabditis elegans TaxID=6239 RepID=Q23205_CAEEL|nr:Major sperm protein [Caenorhabditis elegans]CCD63989.1 Major sperm protein [Caenorhabditis elegans]|eukprot:NP_497228.1 Uncharacterized protein CELE_W06E11.2 [Caenorhabditis elegans]
MGKKRKHQDSDSEQSGKRVKKVEEARNGVADMTIDESSDFQVFLIKKPIGVSLEDLEALKWSNDEEVLTKTKLKTESGVFRAIVAPKSKKERMVHIPAFREREEADSKNIKAQSFVTGAITILPQEVKPKVLGGFIYEEGEEPVEGSSEVHPGLKKIKKTAILDLESRQQRNKAYGTTTEGDGKPRKLANIIEKMN